MQPSSRMPTVSGRSTGVSIVELLLQCHDCKFKFCEQYSLQLLDKMSDGEFDLIISKLNETVERCGPNPSGLYQMIKWFPLAQWPYRSNLGTNFNSMYKDLMLTCDDINQLYGGRINLRKVEKVMYDKHCVETWYMEVHMEVLDPAMALCSFRENSFEGWDSRIRQNYYSDFVA